MVSRLPALIRAVPSATRARAIPRACPLARANQFGMSRICPTESFAGSEMLLSRTIAETVVWNFAAIALRVSPDFTL